MNSEERPLGFKNDISILFRPMDINAMRDEGLFDLSKYEDVKANASLILTALKRPAGSSRAMPCDGPWSQEKIQKFETWIAQGMLP